MKDSGVLRDEFFIATKLWLMEYGFRSSQEAANASMKRLQVDYLDLVFITFVTMLVVSQNILFTSHLGLIFSTCFIALYALLKLSILSKL